MNVTLPDGGTAVLRDPRTMPARFGDMIDDAQMDMTASPAGAISAGAKTQDEADALQAEFDALPDVEQMRRFGKEGVRAVRAYSRAVVLALVESWPYGDVTEQTLLDSVPGDALEVLEAECSKVMKATGGASLTVAPELVDGQLAENPSEPLSA